MQCHVLYFARLREVFGRDNETIGLDKPLPTVADLIALLCQREGVWAAELQAGKPFRVAVDQEMAGGDTPLNDGCEIAIFPPVTGG